MNRLVCFLIIFGIATLSFGQVAILSQAGDTLFHINNEGVTRLSGSIIAPSAIMDIRSTEMGFLPPRLSTTQRNAIGNPAEGLTIYNTTTECIEIYNGSAWKNTCDCNWAPQAHQVDFEGILWMGETLTGTYTYSDNELDPEGASIYRWYRADDAAGTNASQIAGASALNYTTQSADEDKYLAFQVTPVAQTGSSPGTTVISDYRGPALSSITQMSCGQNLSYEVVYAAGYSWLDRNLGASRPAVSSDDYLAYGSLFQWGRIADGHECINWISSTESDGAEQSNESDDKCRRDDPTAPCDNLSNPSAFITEQSWTTRTLLFQTWWNENTTGLYDPIKGDADPCPAGFRVPTKQEWEIFSAEYMLGETNPAASILASPLKLPLAGLRTQGHGSLDHQDFGGNYWSSTYAYQEHAYFFNFHRQNASGTNGIGPQYVGHAQSVRCIEE
jgi:uncharacterized protein (TIGR02145 family)